LPPLGLSAILTNSSALCAGNLSEVLSLLKSVQESQLEMKESQLEMKESQLEMKASQLEMKASQLEIKEVVTVFSAAALDLWAGCSTTNTERDRFRDELVTHYEAPAASGGLRCMVSGCVMESSALNAAHIWPARARNSLATMFSLTLADLDSYRNGILMTASLEKQFDAQRVAFSYDVLHDTFLFHVLDRRLNKETPKGLSMKFEALENKALLHPPGKMPFRRLLVWHYASALMKAKSAGWLDDDALAALPRVPPKEQWMQNRSPGAKMPNEYAFWPALARSMVDETRRASDAEDDD
jgi:HNH endonuclease